ncbi:aminotransferase class I/II-fold pyridoxal phosphate-dependent enzyme [Qiania dongpingensis]|uniref:Aminotransferase class I/II-fold pyridoxal phosphate-dependent enzyme n=1 Tax=Qiania dongpingensis TaxID=2763669 RepID=A0A7G9G5S1_9FIRM|nr:aminotransferase class I/II-fold pyridoxal phosphate-dependent enzyme [Qiania dongpingensis]QNM06153.1 aminotransferase class I/II-fold pyridoxal phosphate-dependent enzyme [Qiania dongpingensis]
MKKVTEMTREELLELQKELQKQYEDFKAQGLKLDMSRGKPAAAQLDLTNGLLTALDDYHTESGLDARNYGVLDGIPEAKRLFSDLLGIPAEKIIVGGSSSLNLMYDEMMRLMLFGTQGEKPWKDVKGIKFLCPSPGYDRHFAVTEDMGIEMIPVPMSADGPDMDVVEKMAAEDEAIKGIWCVPLHSNPLGACYTDETVDRLASMKTAAKDFRIFWDNAYGVHHIYEEVTLKDIFKAAEACGNEDRILYFFSTSKITFPGAGLAIMAASVSNVAEIKKHMTVQTIGYDKLNQLRHVKYFKTADNIRAHMRKLGDALRPKFDMVLNTLEEELGGTGLASWVKPKGGYFIALDTLPGCAKATVAFAKEAGVVMTGAGATYPYKKDPKDSNIRIAPTYPTPEELDKAIHLFCLCVKMSGVNELLKQRG